ncbi:MAG: hypothetical protein ACYS6I_00775 [Planctomycetota bacterium]|jgi:prepilin-type processing-associated H-X9-DG protein
MSEKAKTRLRTSNAWRIDKVDIAIFIAGIILVFLISLMRFSQRRWALIGCGLNVGEGFDKWMLIYAQEFATYPTPNRWCDLLLENTDISAKTFVCRGALLEGDKGRCHYAVNPNCEPNSPPDMVLLFETKGGWNQYGGPELLTFDNHGGKGCYVLFNDGHVEFIEPKDVGKLKWKVEQDKDE